MKPNETQNNRPPSVDKSKYFHRTVVYTKQKDQVVLVDMHDAKPTPALDPWLGKVYLLADGQHTIQNLVDFISKYYEGTPPKDLLLTIDSVIGRLLEAEIIGLSDAPVNLPYYLATSADKQDPKLATKLMLEDGYMQPKS